MELVNPVVGPVPEYYEVRLQMIVDSYHKDMSGVIVDVESIYRLYREQLISLSKERAEALARLPNPSPPCFRLTENEKIDDLLLNIV
jgi:hypothetical protein